MKFYILFNICWLHICMHWATSLDLLKSLFWWHGLVKLLIFSDWVGTCSLHPLVSRMLELEVCVILLSYHTDFIHEKLHLWDISKFVQRAYLRAELISKPNITKILINTFFSLLANTMADFSFLLFKKFISKFFSPNGGRKKKKLDV